jgi:transcriptional regulator NrdR family protein|tara:strand:- start:699 stop:944 length:246 start_codon:yes stop_codon:yes gene_type:complete
MFCPFCVQGKTMVLDSSWEDTHKTIKRQRLCLACSYRWTTLEIDLDQVEFLDEALQKNLKKDNSQFPPKRENDDIDQPMEG